MSLKTTFVVKKKRLLFSCFVPFVSYFPGKELFYIFNKKYKSRHLAIEMSSVQIPSKEL